MDLTIPSSSSTNIKNHHQRLSTTNDQIKKKKKKNAPEPKTSFIINIIKCIPHNEKPV